MINLLPPAEKEKVYNLLFKKQLSAFGVSAALALLAGGFFIFNTYIFLKIHVSEIGDILNRAEINKESQEAQGWVDDVGALNGLLVRYQNLQTEKVSAFRIFAELQKAVPVGAKLNALTFDAASRKITLGGEAQSRDDVLLLENHLKNSAVFYKLESPLSNFLEKNNPTFSFAFYLR